MRRWAQPVDKNNVDSAFKRISGSVAVCLLNKDVALALKQKKKKKKNINKCDYMAKCVLVYETGRNWNKQKNNLRFAQRDRNERLQAGQAFVVLKRSCLYRDLKK